MPRLFPWLLLEAMSIIVASIFISCEDETTGPRPLDCWMGVDRLLASGIAVSDTADAHMAFDRFVTCADSGGCRSDAYNFRPMRYETSRFHWTWQSRRYWSVTHWELKPECGGWILQQYIYVDDRGTVVIPFGCI